MSIPSSQELQYGLVRLLRAKPNQRMHCTEVYSSLASEYPQLTRKETQVPYRNSRSKFANEVQWAVHRLRKAKLLLPVHHSGRGYWQLSENADALWPPKPIDAEALLRELETSK
jgi:restriction endonuclease Mrr